MSLTTGTTSPYVSILKLQPPRPKQVKELNNSDDPHYEKDPQKWPELQCIMYTVKYKARSGSCVRITHHILSIDSTGRV